MVYQLEIEETQPAKRAARLLEDAEQAARAGNHRRAYELSLQATEAAPRYAPAWALRTEFAPSVEEKIACMNRLNELQPDQHGRHNSNFYFLKELLDRDPFLAYLEETNELYHALNKDMTVLRIPKRRTPVEPYPPDKPSSLASAHRWLALALFGLLMAGIPTLIFAPLAARSALNMPGSRAAQTGRVHATAVQIGALILFAIGSFFTVLLVLHLI